MRKGYRERPLPFDPPGAAIFADDTIASVPCRIAQPRGSDTDAVLLHLHGGAYVFGPDNHNPVYGNLAVACDARIIAPDYRLAPEHPFPAAVEDSIAVYAALLQQGVEPGRLVVGGDSAGGGLALATLFGAREAGLAQPAAAVLLSAWADLTQSGESYRTRADVDPMIAYPLLSGMAQLYLAGADPQDARASPVFGDFKGLPPLLVHVGDHEVLLDDSRTVARRAREAGVEVTLEVWPEMIHGWHLFAPALPEATEAIDRIGEYVRGKLD